MLKYSLLEKDVEKTHLCVFSEKMTQNFNNDEIESLDYFEVNIF